MESRGLLLPRKLARMGSIREDDARVHVCIHACSFLSVHSLILSLSLSLSYLTSMAPTMVKKTRPMPWVIEFHTSSFVKLPVSFRQTGENVNGEGREGEGRRG